MLVQYFFAALVFEYHEETSANYAKATTECVKSHRTLPVLTTRSYLQLFKNWVTIKELTGCRLIFLLDFIFFLAMSNWRYFVCNNVRFFNCTDTLLCIV